MAGLTCASLLFRNPRCLSQQNGADPDETTMTCVRQRDMDSLCCCRCLRSSTHRQALIATTRHVPVLPPVPTRSFEDDMYIHGYEPEEGEERFGPAARA